MGDHQMLPGHSSNGEEKGGYVESRYDEWKVTIYLVFLVEVMIKFTK